MSLIKSAFLVPAVVSGLWVVKHEPPRGTDSAVIARKVRSEQDLQLEREIPQAERVEAAAEPRERATRAVVTRRMRVDRILDSLEQVSEVTLQMSPEQQVRLEPVINDLTEQATELSSDKAVRAKETDAELDRLETTLDKLVTSMTRIVEPEMSL